MMMMEGDWRLGGAGTCILYPFLSCEVRLIPVPQNWSAKEEGKREGNRL